LAAASWKKKNGVQLFKVPAQGYSGNKRINQFVCHRMQNDTQAETLRNIETLGKGSWTRGLEENSSASYLAVMKRSHA
jgi:hypothetical protein